MATSSGHNLTDTADATPPVRNYPHDVVLVVPSDFRVRESEARLTDSKHELPLAATPDSRRELLMNGFGLIGMLFVPSQMCLA